MRLILVIHHVHTKQEVTSECKGNYYQPTSNTCESKLDKVNEVTIIDVCEGKILTGFNTFSSLEDTLLNTGYKRFKHI